MSKQRNQFAGLPEQDRKYILELCSKQHYDDVVHLLKQRRSEGGLDIATSKSALCRFYVRHQVDSEHAVLAQKALASTIRHEQDSNAFLGAIASSIQARVYENLARGQALADLHQDLHLLKTAQQLYLADCKWRTANPREARANYQELVERTAELPDEDFFPIAEVAAQPDTLLSLQEAHLSDFDRDVLLTRERQHRKAAESEQIRAKLEAYRAAREEAAQRQPSPRSAGPEEDHKSPEIPPIPPNSTPPENSLEADAHGLKPQDQPPKHPFIRLAAKIGRNDPCPCGSGRKSKKCCLTTAQPSQARAA